MSTEFEKTALGVDGHPDENQLLLALERELSPAEALEVERHLGVCWSCRARTHEMQRGILTFVEYREKCYLPSLEAPPHDFGGFPGQMSKVVDTNPAGWHAGIWRRFCGFLTSAGQVKWVTATAAIMVLVVVWTQVLNPPPVSASEFLTRAAAAQNPAEPHEEGRRRHTAHQRVRISSREETVVRDFEWTAGSPIQQARWEMKEEPSAWNSPLTAAGFAGWRESVTARSDKVKRSGDRMTLDTAAGGDRIKQAWIVVRASDFHPIEQHIRFADDRQLDFEELAFEISIPQQPVRESISSAQVAKSAPASPREVAPAPPVDLNETELGLRYAMFTHQWDLGEDLRIARTPAGIAVSGTASSVDRAGSMQAFLSGLPNVQPSISAPGAFDGQPVSSPSAPAKSAAASSPPLLRDVLEKAFGSSELRREFVDRCLTASDTALSHAWALKKLVDRYGEPEERLLKPGSRAKLGEMLRAHLQQLGETNRTLDPLVELLPASREQKSEAPASWRAGILALFAQVQLQDSLIASLIAGTQTNGPDAPAAAQSFRSAHEAIGVLLGGLDNLEAGRERK